MTDQRLYLLVRRDLPKSVQAVQAAHAAIELVHRGEADVAHPWGEYGPTISMLVAGNEHELEHWAEILGEAAVVFREPDIGGEATALAYFGDRQPGFEELRLL